MSKVTELVTALVSPVASSMGIEIWDIEFERVGGEQYLRVLIDKPDGVSIEDCEHLSRAIDPLLDETDFIKGNYMLEVASAGLERTLLKPEHFLRYIGKEIDVRLYKPIEGRKTYSGTLKDYNPERIELMVGDAPLSVPIENLSKANLKFIWQ